MQPFSAEWLDVRERFDARSRSRSLAQQFAAMLPDEPRILELGAGTGSLFRWLAPIIGRKQHWICLDHDAAHLDFGLRRTAAWARARGYTVRHDASSHCLSVHAPRATWSIETRCGDVAESIPAAAIDGATCSALLDLLPEDGLETMLHVLRDRPFYAAMTVLGRQWTNRQHPRDRLVMRGFADAEHGLFPAEARLGPDAVRFAQAVCRTIGLNCVTARSDWSIGPRDRDMLRHLLGFHASGARAASPRHRRLIDGWEHCQHIAIDARRLAMRVAHSDILVFPSGGPRDVAGRRRRRLHGRD
jgi:SAM-dependent methyltransferase